MLKFMSLGSGSCGNCYYFETEEGAFLIDAGLSPRMIKNRLLTQGLTMDKIKAVFVTHDHADHVKSVSRLSERLDIPIYATELVHEGIHRNLGVKPKLKKQYIRYINHNHRFTMFGLKFTPFHVPHDSRDNVGYYIEGDGFSFTLMTDIGHVTEEMEYFIRKTNYLVIEANYDKQMLLDGKYPEFLKERILSNGGHLCNDITAETIVKNYHPSLKRIWLCHLSGHNNRPDVAYHAVADALRKSGVKIDEDVTVEAFQRKEPSKLMTLEKIIEKS